MILMQSSHFGESDEREIAVLPLSMQAMDPHRYFYGVEGKRLYGFNLASICAIALMKLLIEVCKRNQRRSSIKEHHEWVNDGDIADEVYVDEHQHDGDEVESVQPDVQFMVEYPFKRSANVTKYPETR